MKNVIRTVTQKSVTSKIGPIIEQNRTGIEERELQTVQGELNLVARRSLTLHSAPNGWSQPSTITVTVDSPGGEVYDVHVDLRYARWRRQLRRTIRDIDQVWAA